MTPATQAAERLLRIANGASLKEVYGREGPGGNCSSAAYFFDATGTIAAGQWM